MPAGVWALAVMSGPIGLLVVLFYFSAKALLRQIRYGAWELECPDPGVPLGQTSVVTVIPRQAVTPSGEIECALLQVHRRSQRTRSHHLADLEDARPRMVAPGRGVMNDGTASRCRKVPRLF